MNDMVVDESMALRNWKVSQGIDPNNLKVLSMLSGQRPFLNSIVPAGPGKIGSSDKTNAELRNPHNTKLRQTTNSPSGKRFETDCPCYKSGT